MAAALLQHVSKEKLEREMNDNIRDQERFEESEQLYEQDEDVAVAFLEEIFQARCRVCRL